MFISQGSYINTNYFSLPFDGKGVHQSFLPLRKCPYTCQADAIPSSCWWSYLAILDCRNHMCFTTHFHVHHGLERLGLFACLVGWFWFWFFGQWYLFSHQDLVSLLCNLLCVWHRWNFKELIDIWILEWLNIYH